MATKHDVNFRSDGDVSAELIENDDNCCLVIGSRRQSVQISLNAEQADAVKEAICPSEVEVEPDENNRADKVTAPPAEKKKTAKKTTKKKTAKKGGKKKTTKKSKKGT